MKTGLRTTFLSVTAGLSLMAAPALADLSPGNYYDHGMNGWSGGWFLGPLFMILMIAAIAAAIAVLVRLFGGMGGGSGAKQNAALDLLNARFAKGEIDEDEYQRRKQVLLG